MILYHETQGAYLPSILRYGLFSCLINWIVYLSPVPKKGCFGEICLRVETSDARLTTFEGCEKWEVLCWDYIPPENIQIYDESIKGEE